MAGHNIRLGFEIAGSGGVICSLKVGGDFENADLVVGDGIYKELQVGALTIGDDFIASRIAIATTAGSDAAYGTADDKMIDLATFDQISRVASLVIKGQASGTAGGNDSYRIIAGEFGSIKIGPKTFNLAPVAGDNIDHQIGSTGDLAIRIAELAI